MQTNNLRILGIPVGIDPKCLDPKAIKAAYNRMALKHHPDKGGDPNMFREVKDAYDSLARVYYMHMSDATDKQANARRKREREEKLYELKKKNEENRKKRKENVNQEEYSRKLQEESRKLQEESRKLQEAEEKRMKQFEEELKKRQEFFVVLDDGRQDLNRCTWSAPSDHNKLQEVYTAALYTHAN